MNETARILSFVLACSICSGVLAEAAANSTKSAGPKLWVESTAIDLGRVAVDQDKIEGVIRYIDWGDEVLESAPVGHSGGSSASP
jgi:hypothetical protein